MSKLLPNLTIKNRFRQLIELMKTKIESLVGTPQTITIPELKTFSVVYDNVAIPAGGRVNLQTIEFSNFPEGFKIIGYYQISKLKATSASSEDESWKKVSIESFSTTGGTTRPNVSFFNNGDTEALIKATFGCVVMKQTQYTINSISSGSGDVTNLINQITNLNTQITKLENKLNILTNFEKLALPVTLSSASTTYAELQEELDTLTDGKYTVIENSVQTGMVNNGYATGTIQVRDNETNEVITLPIMFPQY